MSLRLTYVLLILGCFLTLAYPQCATFYVDINEQGESFQLCNSGDVQPWRFNDQASSFVIPDGIAVTLYTDVDYQGPSYGPYGPGTYNVPPQFNDELSSVRITKSVASGKSGCVTFYVDINEEGESFQLCKSGDVEPWRFNDQVSSFVVPAGVSVTLYTDVDYQGPSYGPYGPGTYNVPPQFNDELSSVKIVKGGAKKSSCAYFYQDINKGGLGLRVCGSGNLPAKYNDMVSSFVVPAGKSVTLYTDINYGGPSYGPYGPGTYNVPSQFNDQLSSLKINSGSFLIEKVTTVKVAKVTELKKSSSAKKKKIHH